MFLIKFFTGFMVGQMMASIHKAGHIGLGAAILASIGITFILCILLDKGFSNDEEK